MFDGRKDSVTNTEGGNEKIKLQTQPEGLKSITRDLQANELQGQGKSVAGNKERTFVHKTSMSRRSGATLVSTILAQAGVVGTGSSAHDTEEENCKKNANGFHAPLLQKAGPEQNTGGGAVQGVEGNVAPSAAPRLWLQDQSQSSTGTPMATPRNWRSYLPAATSYLSAALVSSQGPQPMRFDFGSDWLGGIKNAEIANEAAGGQVQVNTVKNEYKPQHLKDNI